MGSYDPTAYVYEADTHCPDCALERFGRDEHGDINGEDSEGNPVGIIAPWDEDSETYVRGLTCGSCGAEISEAHPWVLTENTPGYLPESDPEYHETFSQALESARERALECAWALYEPEGEDWTDEQARLCLGESLQEPSSDEHGNRDRTAYVSISVEQFPPVPGSHDLGRVITVGFCDE